MFGFNPTQIAAAAVAVFGVLAFLFLNRGAIGGFLASWIPTGIGSQQIALDDNTRDFQALDRLENRFTKRKCKEGLAAVEQALTHFYHGDEDHP